MTRQFWWAENQDQRRVHWTAWENLTKLKVQGGVGFRDNAFQPGFAR